MDSFEENLPSSTHQIPFEKLLSALLDVDQPLPLRYLYRLSDLEASDLLELQNAWPQVPLWRRQALLQDIEAMSVDDYILSFEAFCRFALEDRDAIVRELATRTLSEYESDGLLPLYIKLVNSDNDGEVRAAAATALGRYVYLGEVEELDPAILHDTEECLLEVAINDLNNLARRRALESLGYSSREEINPMIEDAFSSSDEEWQVSALFAMGRSANKIWAEMVLDKLISDSPEIRSEAARAAGELELVEAVPKLIELLKDLDDNTRMASVWSLSQIGGDGVREVIEDLYEVTEDDVQAEFIDEALDNLAFTEDFQVYNFLDIPEEDQNSPSKISDNEILDMTMIDEGFED